VVVGASGFIGSWVVRELALRGARVTAVLRTQPGVASVTTHALPGVETRVQSLEPESDYRWLERARPQIVFNLAGYGVDPLERDEATARWVNHGLVAALCERCALAAHDRVWQGLHLVHVGSALEYGAIRGNLHEDSSPRPTTLYGRTKLAGTREVERAVRNGLRAATARLFTVYGPGEHPGRLIPTLIAAMRGKEPIPLTAGTQLRDFTYVKDVAEGLLRLGAARPLEHPTFNLATGRLTAVKEVVRLLAELLEISTARLEYGALPTRAEEMSHEPVSVARAAAALGWTPPTQVHEGLSRTVEQALTRDRPTGPPTL
jgi:UDP-glucose 4-epimerase